MTIYEPVLAALGVWRITHLLAAEDGPWDLVVRLRRAAGDGFAGQLLDCFYCLSLWIGAPFALACGTSWRECGLLWPALSALAIFLERLTAPRSTPPPPLYVEDQEVPPCPAVEVDGRRPTAPPEVPSPSATSSATSAERR